MREDYRDYHRTNHGGGVVEIFEYGHTSFEFHGVPVVPCDECHEMKLETELDAHDGICKECFEYAHTCQDCDKVFPDITLDTVDGYPFCESCLDKQEKLAQIKPMTFKPFNMVDFARTLVGLEEAK